MIEIGPASREEVAAFLCGTVEHTVLRINGMAVALGAVTAVPGQQRAWAGLDLAPQARACGATIVRAIRRHLRDRNKTIYVTCAGPHAARLLAVLGFAPIDEWVANRKQVWIWRTR